MTGNVLGEKLYEEGHVGRNETGAGSILFREPHRESSGAEKEPPLVPPTRTTSSDQ